MKKRLQPHIMCGVGDVAKYVLIPGDPGRVEKIAAFLDASRRVGNYRGFVTYTGSVEGIAVSACSTGVGGPSAAIAVGELVNIGAETLIRVGTTGALQPHLQMGHIVIPSGAVRAEGTSRSILPVEYPAVPDFTVTQALIQAAKKSRLKSHFGPVLTTDVFYGDVEDLKRWSRLHVLSVEMECSTVFTLAKLRKVRAAAVLAVDGNPLTGVGKGEFEPGEKTGEMDERVQEAIEEEIRIAIEAIKTLEKEPT